MSIATASRLTGSFSEVVGNLFELEKYIHPDLRVYRWTPRAPDLPCVWNALPANSPLLQLDQAHFRDNLTLNVHIGIRHADGEDETARLEEFIDAFRQVVDPALHARRPLGAAKAMRTGLFTTTYTFGGDTPVLAVVFPILIAIDRMISPS